MKLKSSKGALVSTNPARAERPVIELCLPDDETNLMMAELSRRFSLLRGQSRDLSSIEVIQQFHSNSSNPHNDALLRGPHFANLEQTLQMESSAPAQPDQPQNTATWSFQLDSSRHHQELSKSLSALSDSYNSKISSDERRYSLKSISSSSSLSSSYHPSRDHSHIFNVSSNSNNIDNPHTPPEPLSHQQLISPSNLRYMDLLTIQQTLSSSASPPLQSDPPSSWASFVPPRPSTSPLPRRQLSSSTTSRTSLNPLPVRSPVASDSSPHSIQTKLLSQPPDRSSPLNQFQRTRSKSISTERSRPSGSSSIISSASALDLHKPNHFQTGLPALASSLHTISPDLQSFPATPLPYQALHDLPNVLTRSASLSDVTGQAKLSVSATGFPLQEVEEEDGPLNTSVKTLTDQKPPRPSKPYSTSNLPKPEDQPSPMVQTLTPPNLPLTHDEPFSGFFPRQRTVSGRTGRPVPTTLLFRDVEAQAVAANAALGLAVQGNNFSSTTGARSEEAEEKKRRKKKSIVRAQIGAPTLLSASSNLAGIGIQPVLSEDQEHTKQDDEVRKKKSGSVRSPFKLRLRKKKTSEEPTSPPLPLTMSNQINAALPSIDESRLVMNSTPIMSAMERNTPPKGTSSSPSTVSLTRRETDPGLLSNARSLIHHRSRSSGGSSNNRLLGRRKDSREAIIGQAQVQDKFLAEQESHSDEASIATGNFPSLPNGGTASHPSPDGHGSLKKSIRRLLNPRNAHVKLSPLADGGHHTTIKVLNEDSILEEPEEERGDGPSSGSPRSSGWVNVGVDSVAPLKITKMGGGTVKRSRSSALNNELLAAVGRGTDISSGGVPIDQGPKDATAIDSALSDLPSLPVVEERESTDSVQRLFTDLGLPQREDDKRSSKGSHHQLLVSRWSAAARGRSGGEEVDEQPELGTQWSRSTDGLSYSGLDLGGDRSSKNSKATAMMTVEDVDWAAPGSDSGSVSGRAVGSADLVVVAPAEVEGSYRDLLLHPQQHPRRRKISGASSASLLKRDCGVTGIGEEDDRDTKSDYAASILDLYARPDSGVWEDGERGGSPSQHVIQSGSELQVGDGSGVRPRKRSFLDAPYRKPDAGDGEDVMDLMNRFRQDLNSSRVSTASGLLLDGAFSGSNSVGNSNGRGNGAAGTGGSSGRRKTVVDDEEDEERVWKIILGR